MECYKIYKRSLAYQLSAMGNIMLDKIEDERNNKRFIYIFQDTDKLHKDLTTLDKKLKEAR